MKFLELSRWSDGEEIAINIDHIIMIELHSVLGTNQEYVNLTKITMKIYGELIVQEDIDYVLKLIKEIK